MKGTVSQSPLDSPGDEGRRNRQGPGKGGGGTGESGEGGREWERKMEKNVEGRRSQGVQKCPSSQARAALPSSPEGPKQAEFFAEPALGLVVSARSSCGPWATLTLLRASREKPRVWLSCGPTSFNFLRSRGPSCFGHHDSAKPLVSRGGMTALHGGIGVIRPNGEAVLIF